MKISGMHLMVGLIAVAISLTAVSCSREKAGKQDTGKSVTAENKTAEILKGVEESKKHVIAQVNSAEITMNDLITRMNQMAPQYVSDRSQRTPEIDRKLQQEALDDLIFRELAFQEAVRQGMKVQPEAVKKTIDSLRSAAGSEEAFKNNLKLIGATEESFRKDTEKDLLVDMIVDKEINKKIRVDEKQIKAAYTKKKTKFVHPESLDIEDVVVMKSKDAAADMKKANELLATLKKNNNDSSKLSPDKTFVVREGGLSKEEYPNIFKAVQDLKPGVLSSVIKEDDGLHIVRITGRMPSVQMTFEEARPFVEKELKGQIAGKMRQQWAAQMKKTAKIEMGLKVEDHTASVKK